MSTRKIKDAKDTSTNELIYFKGHAKATFTSDGKNVEEGLILLDNNKQNTLVSGVNIKTINNQSILGSGDITISGSCGGASPTVEFVSGNSVYIDIFDNTIYICEAGLQNLEIYADEQLNVGSIIRFYTLSDFTLETGDVLWANGVIPNFESNTSYELSITSSQMTGEMLAVLTPFKPV